MNGHGGRREGAGRKLGSCIAPELKKRSTCGHYVHKKASC